MNRATAGVCRSSPVFARSERANAPASWPDISDAAPAGAWCDQRLVCPGLDAELPGRLIALAASWTAQAQTFAARFGGRRQRVLTTATQHVPAANLSTVTVSSMLDWLILCSPAANFDAPVPEGWTDEVQHVWMGVCVDDWRAIPDAIRSLGFVTTRRRFIWLTSLLNDAESLDLEGVDWLIVGHPAAAIADGHLAALKAQAMYWGVPVWCARSGQGQAGAAWQEAPCSLL